MKRLRERKGINKAEMLRTALHNTELADLCEKFSKIAPFSTGWLSWLEHRPVHQKIAGLIPSQGIYLGCGFDPCLERL